MNRAGLFRLVDLALANPGGEVWLAIELDRHSADVAVLVIDLAGFSRLTRNRGTGGALMATRRLQLVVIATVERHGGRVVKFDADNGFCAFPDVVSAHAAAGEIVAAEPSCGGISVGRVVVLDDDFYGEAVNDASRLGEDIATIGQVLLTDAAQECLSVIPCSGET